MVVSLLEELSKSNINLSQQTKEQTIMESTTVEEQLKIIKDKIKKEGPKQPILYLTDYEEIIKNRNFKGYCIGSYL